MCVKYNNRNTKAKRIRIDYNTDNNIDVKVVTLIAQR